MKIGICRGFLSVMLVVVGVTGLTGCASRFPGGVYRSPDGVLKCRVPVSPYGPWLVQRGQDAKSQSVAFIGETGTLYRTEVVDVRALPGEFQKMPVRDQVMSTVQGPLLANILEVAPKARMVVSLYQENFRGGAAYAVYEVPQGATLVKKDAEGRETRLDATRSLVAFRTGTWLVCATHMGDQLETVIRGERGAKPLVHAKRDLPKLVEFAVGIEVGEKP